ncbi:MAG: hypothetical protein PHP11_00720 [Erysipelotrichaceae bacterium]|nr:hypothetical protein [Erysipelotrichaceae bacterium]MDD3923611.1 hypothetical protein [Erysipelotrichaceae bacterium]MDD4642477.1 hypothetical protein [Erysipelotrichaceae bacterium]
MSSEEKNNLEVVVEELNEKVEEFALVAKEDIKDSSEKVKSNAEEIIEDTIEAIKTLIEQVTIKYDEIAESEKFREFGEAIKGLTASLVSEGKRKIQDIKNSDEIKENWDKTKEAVANTSNKVVESIKENDELMETINVVKGVSVEIAKKSATLIKNAYEDFVSNPKVKESINKAKATTLDVAGKAYEKLEDWLTDDEEEVQQIEIDDDLANDTEEKTE